LLGDAESWREDYLGEEVSMGVMGDGAGETGSISCDGNVCTMVRLDKTNNVGRL